MAPGSTSGGSSATRRKKRRSPGSASGGSAPHRKKRRSPSGGSTSGGSAPPRKKRRLPSGSTSGGLMASGSTSSSSGGSAHRRGLISCLHSHDCRAADAPPLSEDLPQAIHKRIVGFYEEVFNRLPCDAMPDLLRVLTTRGGGSCLGLLDPVSNIILNTLALLPQDASTTSPPAKRRRRSKRKSPDLGLGASPWLQVAYRSYNSLLDFLVAYFGCLTQRQAISYLYRARANPVVAVKLIQHDLYVVEEGEFDAGSDRTQAALEWAATTTGHPSPTVLADVMSIRLNDADLALLKTRLSADRAPLTVDDVWAIHRTLHMIMRPKCSANIIRIKRVLVLNVSTIPGCSQTTDVSTTVDGTTTTSTTFSWGGEGTPISSLHFGGLPRKLKRRCLRKADDQKHYLKTPCGGDACDYLQSLDMYATAIIHSLYIKVLKLLPTPSGPLMCSILKAGHCYGCMDPLSNIIVNSIWYDTCACNLPVSERREMAGYNDVLDPLHLLRTLVYSLEGLTKLAAFTDPQFSVPDCALEFLCSVKCDIANMLTSWTERSEINPFHEAAKAAGHPHPLWLGELHQQLLLMPDVRSQLLSFIKEAQTNDTVLRVEDMTHAISVLWNTNRSEAQTVRPPQLCKRALRAVSSKRSDYEKQRSQIRPKIQQLLKEYMAQQIPGPEYILDTILGVEERKNGRPPFVHSIQYNVNFTATRDLQRHRTLFFAEFSLSHEPSPESCCPIPFAYAGRCYYGVHTARKIVYPDDAKYIRHDITPPGTCSVDDMLEMDLVYFSPKLDVELAKKVNMLPSEEEEEKEKKWKKSWRPGLKIWKLEEGKTWMTVGGEEDMWTDTD